jgi:hypothetical protein
VEEIKNLIQSFSKKIFRFPMLLKKYSDLGGGNKKFDSEFLSYNLMLNSGKKFILTLVLSETKFLSKKKPTIAPLPPLAS